jgi:hypothetical protein
VFIEEQNTWEGNTFENQQIEKTDKAEFLPNSAWCSRLDSPMDEKTLEMVKSRKKETGPKRSD